MPMARIVRLFLAPFLFCFSAWGFVQPRELEDWLASSDRGLAMSREEARSVASVQWSTLTQCGITIQTLQALKDVMYDHTGMDLGMSDLRQKLFPVAEQHISPGKLTQLYQALSSSYTFSGGLGLAKAEAQSMTTDLALRRAEPDQLKALYQVMYGWNGLGFTQKDAQQTSIEQAVAGSNASQFYITYSAAVAAGAPSQYALTQSSIAAVKANLGGLERRYAKNAQPYTSTEFKQYYGDQ